MISKDFLRKYYQKEGETFIHQEMMYQSITEFGYLNMERKKALFSFLKRKGIQRFLDIGCAEGQYVISMAKNGCFSIGIDISLPKVKRAKERNIEKTKFLLADAEDLPFKANSFDSVLMTELLEHLPYPLRALSEAKRVSKKWILLSVPLFESEYAHYKQFQEVGLGHLRDYTPKLIYNQLDSLNLRIKAKISIGHCNRVGISKILIKLFKMAHFPLKLLLKLIYKIIDPIFSKISLLEKKGAFLIIHAYKL